MKPDLLHMRLIGQGEQFARKNNKSRITLKTKLSLPQLSRGGPVCLRIAYVLEAGN
jgi:hypothetical protein